METKHLFALALLFGCGGAALLTALISSRFRAAAFFALVFGSMFIDHVNAVFAGAPWYRGTVRGFEISAVDIFSFSLLGAMLALGRHEKGRLYWPAGLGALLVYFGYALLVVALQDAPIHGWWEMAKMARGLVVYAAVALFVRTSREVAILVAALALAAGVQTLVGLEQRFVRGAFRVSGLLEHENTLSTYFCTISPVLLAGAMSNWRKSLRWCAGLGWVLCAGGVLLTLSRMGIPVFVCVNALMAAMCGSWRFSWRKLGIALGGAAAIGACAVFSWDALMARYRASDLKAEFTDESAFETRGVYWRIAFLMVRDHPFGVGLNNWSYQVGKSYGRDLGHPYGDYDAISAEPTPEELAAIRLPPAADTLPALTLGELGVAGAVLLSVVWLRWFYLGAALFRHRLDADPLQRVALGCACGVLGLFLQSATEWTYKQTPVLFTVHAIAGTLASLYGARNRPQRGPLAPLPPRDVARKPTVPAVAILPAPAARATP